MRKRMLPVVAGAVVLAPAALAGDVIIDTIPEWGDSRSNGWDKIAQTLVVPEGATVLSTFEFGVGSDAGASFNLVVFEWDRSSEHTVGPELYNSGPVDVKAGPVEFVEFTLDLPLASGEEFAVIVDWDPDGSGNGVGFLSGSSYEDGYANFTNGGFDEAWSFNSESGFDMAFRAVFTPIPAPGALALLGFAGLARRRRRRR